MTHRDAEQLVRIIGEMTEVEKRELVERLARSLNGGQSATKPRRRLADIADSVAATVPAEEWAKLPPDLAKNFEHYRYGYPRED